MNNCMILHQAVLNLMYRSDNTTILTGIALNEEECRKEAETNEYLSAVLDLNKIITYSFFGDYENGAKLSLRVGNNLEKASPASPSIPPELFHRCMCLLVQARQIKSEEAQTRSDSVRGWRSRSISSSRGNSGSMESKYVKAARQGIAKIKNWVAQGHPNSRHYESLLEAELAAYEGKINLAKECYERGISMASQSGYLHDRALGNERYGEFLLRLENMTSATTTTKLITHGQSQYERRQSKVSTIMNMNSNLLEEATFRLQESIDLYREWGANAKATILQNKYSQLLSLPSFPNHIEVQHSITS